MAGKDIINCLFNFFKKVFFAKLYEENIRLKEQLAEKEKIDNIRKNLEPINNVYYLTDENGKRTGPYCTRCFDHDKNLIHLHDYGNFFYCPHCKNVVRKDDYKNGPTQNAYKGWLEW